MGDPGLDTVVVPIYAWHSEQRETAAMIFQVIDADNRNVRLWTGSAASANEHRLARERLGRTVEVADYKGRRLSVSDLYDCAARENERHAIASLAGFRRLMEARETSSSFRQE